MRRTGIRWSVALFAASVAYASVASSADKEECANAYVAAQTQRISHELLSARATLSVCARAECAPFMRGQLVRDCSQWLTDVNARIPTVVISLRTPSGEPPTDTQIFVDGAGPKAPDAAPIEVNPGQHVFTFKNARETVEKIVTVLEGTKAQIVEGVVTNPIVSTRVAAANLDGARYTGAPAASRSWLSARTVVPWSIGAAGLLTGVVFGLIALHDKGTLDQGCPQKVCGPGSQGDVDALHTHSLVANLGFAVGIAGVVSGVVLCTTSKRDASSASESRSQPETALRLVPGPGAGAQLVGTF
jgi:hypothetical protein